MAKYEVTYECGHVVVEQLYGKYEDRYSYINRAKNRPCPECIKKHNLEVSQEYTEAHSLPELKGSEKQIAWATCLRVDALEALEHNALPYATTPDAINMTDFWRAEIINKTDSAWWIENRYFIPKPLTPADNGAAIQIIKAFVRLFGQNSKN